MNESQIKFSYPDQTFDALQKEQSSIVKRSRSMDSILGQLLNELFSEQPISPLVNALMINQTVILQSYFTQNFNSTSSIVLTLTKSHIIAINDSKIQNEQIFVVQINFDLKFEIIYSRQKDVRSTKIGIKFTNQASQFNCLYSQDTNIIEIWIHHLSKLINQKNFHLLFKPIKKIGKGNFARVYQVQRVTDLRRFAVKAFYKKDTFAKKNGKQSLMNQLSVMRSLNHQNIQILESVFESDNSIYAVFELLSGDSLQQKIQKKKGHFSKDQIRSFMRGLLEGLAYMHQNRIMHRDLKPQNIMLRDQKQMDPVIVDFGLATNVDIDKYLFYRCGTPGYVAPQIASLTKNIHIQPQCDIFSAGVIFHLLLLRKDLFQGKNQEQIFKNNKQMKFDLNSQIYSNLQKEQIQLLKKMLIENPQNRITASQALNHSYFHRQTRNNSLNKSTLSKDLLD